jgi:hypothetical protein
MRLAVAVILCVLLPLALVAKLPVLSPLLNSLAELEILLIAALLAIWALAEAYFLVVRSRANKQAASQPKPAAESGPSKQSGNPSSAAPAAYDSQRLALLEAERDQLREQATQNLLRQKELEEQALALKAKITTLEKAATAPLSEEAIARRALLNFLGTLQEKGRFVDFLMDDLSAYSDQQVGAAARVVHQGCSAVVREQLAIAPVHSGSEGEELALRAGYNPREWRLVGRVAGQPPFNGRVLHKGWKVERFNLTRSTNYSADSAVLVPAELEVA